MSNNIIEATESYMKAICEDYENYVKDTVFVDDERLKEVVSEFKEKLTYKINKKYIKIISDRSVHSFIVKDEDVGFPVGTLLKAAGWNTPAKNFGRGNVFKPETYNNRVRWTGIG